MFINLKNFKNKLADLLDGYSDLKEQAKAKIVEQAKEDLEGYKKKEVVDALVIKGLKALAEKLASPILTIVIDYLIARVPVMTQRIYDHLKERVEGITTEKGKKKNGEK
jgi:hypothetical protein